eukprot:TRINITY_DN81056_c0_g1_i1.p1 TRINITY_DN81056_c0_g1~~TRINITY_DN81056_c0_g1_i1.p1  ORF type:complete len:465 (-),score=59.37 TRINITY_DN81056_c0_g1_i1:120-1514(-)
MWPWLFRAILQALVILVCRVEDGVITFQRMLFTDTASFDGDRQADSTTKAASKRVAVDTERFTVDLDLPPRQRWAAIFKQSKFENANKDIVNYFHSVIPGAKVLVPTLTSIARRSGPRLFRPTEVEEMRGIAEVMGANEGTVYLVNLVYQLEGIGASCKKRNTTGPCPAGREDEATGPNFCTSIVAAGEDGTVTHGRNMDWNLNEALLKYVISVDYTRSGQSLFTATSIAGQVGVLHGLSRTSKNSERSGWSASMNARSQGGNLAATLLDILLHGGSNVYTPTHLLRAVLEEQSSFADAVKRLEQSPLVNPVYYIVAGSGPNEGSVIQRGRAAKETVTWALFQEAPLPTAKSWPHAGNRQAGWYRAQTNYDVDLDEPSYDARRKPAVNNLDKAGQKSMTWGSGNNVTREMWSIMTQFPTLNPHTDITCIMSPSKQTYEDRIWITQSTEVSRKAKSTGPVLSLVV